MVWLEIVGWAGSLLVIVSLTQARVLRFRWLNLAGAVIATAYNTIVGIWPFAVMNGVIAVIDVYWLVLPTLSPESIGFHWTTITAFVRG